MSTNIASGAPPQAAFLARSPRETRPFFSFAHAGKRPEWGVPLRPGVRWGRFKALRWRGDDVRGARANDVAVQLRLHPSAATTRSLSSREPTVVLEKNCTGLAPWGGAAAAGAGCRGN